MRHPLSCSLVFTIALGACARSTSPGPDADAVLGHWEWTTACCSIAGAGRTPATEGYTYVLQFETDGTVEVVRSNTLVFTTHFTVTRSRPDPLADQITIVHYQQSLPHGPAIPPADQHVVFKEANGTLVLRNPQCADCYGEWRFLPRLD